MPTPFEKTTAHPEHNGQWAAQPGKHARSVFCNYSQTSRTFGEQEAERGETIPQFHALEPLQTSIDEAVARSFLYRFLAQAFQDPTKEGWTQLTEPDSRRNLGAAVCALSVKTKSLKEPAALLESQLSPELFEPFLAAYLRAFGHAARGCCPLNEIEYGDLKADPMFQPHRLADIAAFYRAFGLELSPDADERHDHICLELEFMCVLAAKEAYALERQLDADAVFLCRDAQKQFLREHLARWMPAFARRLAQMAIGTPLGALANLVGSFIEFECGRHGIRPGSEDLLLRPVDEAAESICNSCGVIQNLPGAVQAALSPV